MGLEWQWRTFTSHDDSDRNDFSGPELGKHSERADRKWESSLCLDGLSKKAEASQLMHAENTRKMRSDGSKQTGAKMWHLVVL